MQPPGRIFDLNEKRRLGAVAHDLDADGAVAFDLPERFQEYGLISFCCSAL